MIDLRRLLDDPAYRGGIERKRVPSGLVEGVLAADARRRELVTQVEELRRRQNAASKEIGETPTGDRATLVEAAGRLKDELAVQEPLLAEAGAALRELALGLPNPAHESVPDGGEDDGEVMSVVGGTPAAPSLDHGTYAERMGFVDSRHAVEASGSRFASLTREAVLLELALVQWVVTRVVAEGFTPVVPPVLVRERTMVEAGFFPTDRAQVYEVDGGELFLVGTSEIPLSALHRSEVLAADALPARYAGISSCFRREAGTYGKDTTGIFRVHQFDKVELFSFAHPDDSWEELERVLAIQEAIVGGLGLPYRVVSIAAGDLGAPAAKKYDIEVWLPSEGRYRELTSCSNYTDFSARRLDTRVRNEAGTQLVHTLNGTACAVGRTLLFCFEHCQEPDGSFVVPEVLRAHCGLERVEPRG